tara:strand:+ start:230 stop:481 length:252 start_codon:yes stop_codon:yes gene_type:complete
MIASGFSIRISAYFFFVVLFFSNTAFAYMDPASGSAIIGFIIGATVVIGIFLKMLWYKLKLLIGTKVNNKQPFKATKNNKNIQ